MAGKKVLFVIAPENFRDEELLVPKAVLEKAGNQVVVASLDRKVCVGVLGARVMPAITVREAKPFLFSAIVIVGGPGSPALWRDQSVLSLVQGFFSEKKVVGGICLGPVVLAKAGILRGRKATVWSDIHDKKAVKILEENGATYLPTPVVRDGILVTADGPESAQKFGEKLVEVLG